MRAGLARRRHHLCPSRANGAPIEGTPLGKALAGAGFVPSYRGTVLPRP
ncbi:MAG: hypothetical protein ABIJ48_02280 [Actinomycetota bacterium]